MFKLELEGKMNVAEKKTKEKQEEEKIMELIQKYKIYDEKVKYREEKTDKEINEQNENFNRFMRKMCKVYYQKAEQRISSTDKLSIHAFVGEWYILAQKSHKHALKRFFPRKKYGTVKKRNRYDYPIEFRYLFFKMLRRLKRNDEGKLVFAKQDNICYWAPSLSNKCKVHRNYCPLYCKNFSHNSEIKAQSRRNIKTYENINVDKKV